MQATSPPPLDDHYADSDGVRIHYMAGGSGPLIVFIHGFPDYWYSWRHQLDHLSSTHRVAAMDTRGYNLSDKPDGQAQYDMAALVADVAAVIWAEGQASAVVVGHDWGGATAWNFAARFPEMTERLVIINTPHPGAMAQELSRPESPQRASLAYADDFRKAGSSATFTPASLAAFMAHGDAAVHERYLEAFEATDLDAAMHYYRANSDGSGAITIHAPVLQFHGLDDPALLTASVNGTWDYLRSTWTLVTVPNAGHWPHHDQPELVSTTIADWLSRPVPEFTHDGNDRVPAAASAAGGCCG